jgi:hypothetical protein
MSDRSTTRRSGPTSEPSGFRGCLPAAERGRSNQAFGSPVTALGGASGREARPVEAGPIDGDQRERERLAPTNSVRGLPLR